MEAKDTPMTAEMASRKVYVKLPTTGTTMTVTHNIGDWEVTAVSVYQHAVNGTRVRVVPTAVTLLNRDQLSVTVGTNTGDLWIAVAA